MENNKLYAVITGDLIKSKSLSGQREVLSILNEAFSTVQSYLNDTRRNKILCVPFQIFRGDSFQGIISDPELALYVLIVIRASLRCINYSKSYRRKNAPDARLALGIGTVNYLPDASVSEGDGDAFRRSGILLDTLKNNIKKSPLYMAIDTPWPEINKELEVDCALLDSLIYKWSAQQAQAILGFMKGLNQTELGNNRTVL